MTELRNCGTGNVAPSRRQMSRERGEAGVEHRDRAVVVLEMRAARQHRDAVRVRPQDVDGQQWIVAAQHSGALRAAHTVDEGHERRARGVAGEGEAWQGIAFALLVALQRAGEHELKKVRLGVRKSM